MKSIDFKSLLTGILGTALVLVLMGQSSLQTQYEVECLEIDQNVFCRRFDTKEPFRMGNVWLPTLMQFADSSIEPYQ